ncbi:MAG: hypothetical protein RL754_1343 [Bacteroidota bacterium]|jgi:hypothetical protein
MQSAINISIPNPCSERWQSMVPIEGGRHCAVCDKCIVDFTESSDRDILKAYQKEGKLCGKFRPDQLDRFITTPRDSRAPVGIAAAAALSVSTPLSAQTSEAPIVVIPQTYAEQVQANPQEVILKGRVYENETKEPIPFANVQLWSKGEMVYGGATDFDGYFGVREAIVAEHPVDAIVVSSMGYTDIRKSFDPPLTPNSFERLTDDLAIAMDDEQVMLLGDVVIVTKTPWYKRLWWRITRPFH